MTTAATIAEEKLLFAAGMMGVLPASWPWVLLVLLFVIGALLWQLHQARKEAEALHAQIELLSHRRTVVFDFLHDLGEAFTEGISLDELLHLIANFSVNTTQASAGAVFLLDGEKKHLRAEVVIGPFPPPLRTDGPAQLKVAKPIGELEQIVKSQVIALGEGLIGEVAQSGKPVLIQDGLKDPRLVQHDDPALQTRTAIFIPLKFKEEVLGVMAVVNKQAADSAPFFNANDLFLLDSLADHAAISLYNTTLYTLEAEQKRIAGDLRVASEIQRMLLPDHAPTVTNFELAGINIPARHVGGDYYDFLPLDQGHVGVVIADVSGKAIPGALVMTISRSAIRAQSRFSLSPAEVLRHVEEVVTPDLREDMFVTIVYGILDSKERTFTFVRAGHDPVLWYHSAANKTEVIAPRGTAVGLDRRVGKSALEERQLQLAPGDILVLYTDGITESLDAQDREFGRQQLMDVVKANAHLDAQDISRAILERLRQFTGDVPPHDDRTLIVIKAV